MANNVFVKIPERGDACVGRLSDKKLFYIKADTLVTSELDKSEWEVQGVVSYREGRNVVILGLFGTTTCLCNRPWFYMTGFSLDGNEHTIVLAIYTKANMNNIVEKTISYTANTVEEFISALNSAFEADADFTEQDWFADNKAEESQVRIHFDADVEELFNIRVKSGAKITLPLPEMARISKRRSRNGSSGQVFSLVYPPKGLSYYKTDNGLGYGGGRVEEQTSVMQKLPINLPTWLGISEKNPGDFCKKLRDVYGEGEEGWVKFMKSTTPILHCDNGINIIKSGKAITKKLTNFSYVSRKVTSPRPMCEAASYANDYATTCLPSGSWYIPSCEEFFNIFLSSGLLRSFDDLNNVISKANGVILFDSQIYNTIVVANNSNIFDLFTMIYIAEFTLLSKKGFYFRVITSQKLEFD